MKSYIKIFLTIYLIGLPYATYSSTEDEIDQATVFVHPGIAKMMKADLEKQEKLKKNKTQTCTVLNLIKSDFIKTSFYDQNQTTDLQAPLDLQKCLFSPKINPENINNKINAQTELTLKAQEILPSSEEIIQKYTNKVNKIATLTATSYVLAQLLHKKIFTPHIQPSRVFGIDDIIAVKIVGSIIPPLIAVCAGGFAYHQIKKIFNADLKAEFLHFKKNIEDRFEKVNDEIDALTKTIESSSSHLLQASTKLEGTHDQITSLQANNSEMQTLLKDKILPQLTTIQTIMSRTIQNNQQEKSHKPIETLKVKEPKNDNNSSQEKNSLTMAKINFQYFFHGASKKT